MTAKLPFTLSVLITLLFELILGLLGKALNKSLWWSLHFPMVNKNIKTHHVILTLGIRPKYSFGHSIVKLHHSNFRCRHS